LGLLPTRHLAEFLLTVYVLIVVPGPSVLFVVSRGMSLGRRAALATAVGNASGFALQLLLVAVGVGALVARSEAVFTVLKLVGAGYLVLLGVRNIHERKSLMAILRAQAAPKRMRQIVREGFLVGATNPKGLVIFAAVLPRFVDQTRGNTTSQLLVLGAICILIALVSDGVWALLSGSARRWLGGSPRRLEAVGAASGVTLIGLGIGLAVTARQS
jgi:threonine/homoserine/homoserine lactone efflux protein